MTDQQKEAQADAFMHSNAEYGMYLVGTSMQTTMSRYVMKTAARDRRPG